MDENKLENNTTVDPYDTPPNNHVHALLFFFLVLDLILRRKRRGSVTTREPHLYWCVYDYDGTSKEFNDTSTRRQRVRSTH